MLKLGRTEFSLFLLQKCILALFSSKSLCSNGLINGVEEKCMQVSSVFKEKDRYHFEGTILRERTSWRCFLGSRARQL
jgi:hypothetical protein